MLLWDSIQNLTLEGTKPQSTIKLGGQFAVTIAHVVNAKNCGTKSLKGQNLCVVTDSIESSQAVWYPLRVALCSFTRGGR